MDIKRLERLLTKVKEGRLSVAQAVERLRTLPFEDLGFAQVDHHRQLRQGFPEVVFAEGKSLEQIRGILQALVQTTDHILVTRLDGEKAAGLLSEFDHGHYHPDSRVLTLSRGQVPDRGRGVIVVISAGTSDIPVAEEARLTAWIMGHRAEPIYDVGVAGLHRLLAHKELARPPSSWWWRAWKAPCPAWWAA
jgi:NCAIR mutase (PurE)-related protein